MAAANLTTLELVKAQLQLTSVTSFDVRIQSVVDATNQQIESYCNRHFAEADYMQVDYGTADAIIQLRNQPVRAIYYSATGATNGLEITYAGVNVGSVTIPESEDQTPTEIIYFTTGGVSEEIPVTSTDTLNDLIVKIDALVSGDWTASVASSSPTVANFPARALLPVTFSGLEADDDVNLSLSTSTLVIRPEFRTPGDYNANRSIGFNTRYTIIYQGGYKDDAYPPDLVNAATNIATDAVRQSFRDGTLKSERIGNYSWSAGIVLYLDESIRKKFIELRPYRNQPGA